MAGTTQSADPLEAEVSTAASTTPNDVFEVLGRWPMRLAGQTC